MATPNYSMTDVFGYSYSTVIMAVDRIQRKIFVNDHYYSKTTSKHRDILIKLFQAKHPEFTLERKDFGENMVATLINTLAI